MRDSFALCVRAFVGGFVHDGLEGFEWNVETRDWPSACPAEAIDRILPMQRHLHYPEVAYIRHSLHKLPNLSLQVGQLHTSSSIKRARMEISV